MPKVFNTAAICIPQEHYMVNLDSRVREIKKLVDAGKYFTINRARQYGKTTTLRALYRNLMKDYYVVSLDLEVLSSKQKADLQIHLQIPFWRSLREDTESFQRKWKNL
mgnify:CR=1 FL=1